MEGTRLIANTAIALRRDLTRNRQCAIACSLTATLKITKHILWLELRLF